MRRLILIGAVIATGMGCAPCPRCEVAGACRALVLVTQAANDVPDPTVGLSHAITEGFNSIQAYCQTEA